MQRDFQTVMRRYFAIQKVRKSQTLQFLSMGRRGLYSDEEVKVAIKEYCSKIERQERQEIREAVPAMRELALYQRWLKHVRGVGDVMAAMVLGSTMPLERFPTISKLWAYGGLHVIEGKAPRRQKGKRANWSSEIRYVAFNFGTCIEKAKGPYKEMVYTPYKERDKLAHPEKVDSGRKNKKGGIIYDYTPIHMRLRAIRYTAKMFLGHMWIVYHELAGLPVTEPWVLREHAGNHHQHYLSPWEMISHRPVENQSSNASHTLNEDHTGAASHTSSENHTAGASQAVHENHDQIAPSIAAKPGRN